MLMPRTNETVLITLLVKLLNNDWKEEKVLAFLTSINQEDAPDTGLNPLQILVATLHKVNSTDSGNFVLAIQLDIKEPETYN